jgi:hypothetical protein
MTALAFRPDPLQLDDHPAVNAWRAFSGVGHGLDSVEALVSHRGRALKKSAVYRLRGPDLPQGAIIAKQATRASGLFERQVYTELLPLVPVRTLAFYGWLDAPERNACWLFLEDAAGRPYAPADEADRALATRWLAGLHTASAIGHTAARVLPRQHPGEYLACLQAIRLAIANGRSNPALDPPGLLALDRLDQLCTRLQSGWRHVEALFASLPKCLVHGDFTPKNVRVRDTEPCPSLAVFDWELAAWGVPGIDLESVDADTYRALVVETWPELGSEGMAALRGIGSIFLNVGFIEASSGGLSEDWAAHAASVMAMYEPKLARALRLLGW